MNEVTILALIKEVVTPLLLAYIAYKQVVVAKNQTRESKANSLFLRGLSVMGELAYRDSIAIQTGKHNGELQKAQDEYVSWKKDLAGFKNDEMGKII